MRVAIIGGSFLSLFFCHSCKQKTPENCSDIKTGQFYFYPKKSSRQYKIIREDLIQKEIAGGDTSLWKIKWIDECTYLMDYISGAGIENNPHFTTYVKFMSVKKDFYIMRACLDTLDPSMCMIDTIWSEPR